MYQFLSTTFKLSSPSLSFSLLSVHELIGPTTTSHLCVRNKFNIHTLYYPLGLSLLSAHKPLLGTGCLNEFVLFGPMDNVPYLFLDWVPVARTSLFYSDPWTMFVVFLMETVELFLLMNKGTLKTQRNSICLTSMLS